MTSDRAERRARRYDFQRASLLQLTGQMSDKQRWELDQLQRLAAAKFRSYSYWWIRCHTGSRNCPVEGELGGEQPTGGAK